MAILTWPTCAFLTSVEWTPPDPPTQVNRSEWTGREQIVMLQLAGRWSAKVSIEPKQTEDDALDVQAFRVELKGRANSFRMPAKLKPQMAVDPHIQVSGAGQPIGYALSVHNGIPGAAFKRGHLITLADQMMMIMASGIIGGDGTAGLSVFPAMRASPAADAPIEIVNPTCLVKLASPGAAWSNSYPNMIDFAQFDVEETF